VPEKVGSLYALAASATPGVAFVLSNSYPRAKLEDQASTLLRFMVQGF